MKYRRSHRRSTRSRCRPEPAAAVVYMAPAVRQRMPPAPLSPTRPALRFREIAFSFEPPVPGLSVEFLPGLPRFGCDLSATVGGIPNFGKTSQNRGSDHYEQREARPCAMHSSSPLLLDKGMGWHVARHGRYSLINPAA